MNEEISARDIRAAYAASDHGTSTSASRAYVRATAEHQDAALRGDVEAVRAIREARIVFDMFLPEAVRPHPDEDAAQRYARAVRSIA